MVPIASFQLLVLLQCTETGGNGVSGGIAISPAEEVRPYEDDTVITLPRSTLEGIVLGLKTKGNCVIHTNVKVCL